MADETKVSGKLVRDDDGTFAGYSVLTLYFERRTVDDDTGEGEATTVLAEARAIALAAPGGKFDLELPPADSWEGPLVLIAISPGGLALGRLDGLQPADDLSGLELRVAPEPDAAVVTTSDDPTLGQELRYRGRAIDSDGRGLPSGLTILFWGVPPGGGDPDAYPLAVTETTVDGYFSGIWPDDRLDEAYAVISGATPIPVSLEDDRLPRQILLLADEVPTPEDSAGGGTPRAPDLVDFAANKEAFAEDRSGCADFTIPNRTVDELTMQAVVRTTQPAIKGATPPPQKDVPKHLVDRLLELAKMWKYEPIDLEADRGPARFPGEGGQPAGDGEGIRAGAGAALAEMRSTRVLGHDPGAFAEAMLERRDPEREPLRLETTVVAELAREPGPLTPLRLVAAERASLVRRFRYAVDQLGPSPIDRFELNPTHQVDWDDIPYPYQASTIAHGHLLTFRQVWRADGYSLGDLLYSLPLAPGQQKLISLLDWERRETAVREEERRVTEQLRASLSHDRDISEIVRASLHERLDAYSNADVEAAGGALGGFIGPVIFGVAGGYSSAGSTAGQTSSRDTAASALNRARDRTLQAASAIRGQRATVVQTARQGESVRAQTEAIANYNHCHALTIEYFEVLRHFQVSQELVDVQECLLVPFTISAFTQAKAINWRVPLSRGLRLRRLTPAFDALERVLSGWAQVDFPPGRYADENLEHLDGELRMRMSLPRPADKDDDDFEESSWTPYADLLPANTAARDIWDRYMGVVLPSHRAGVWNTRLAPGIARRLLDNLHLELYDGSSYRDIPIDVTLVTTFGQDRQLLVTFRPLANLPPATRANIRRVRLSLSGATIPGNVDIIVESGSMRYRTAHLAHDLFSERALQNDLGASDSVEVDTPIDRIEKRNPREFDERCARELVDHLNEHVEYYHRTIWLTMHPNRRYLLLDGVIAPNADGRSVASVVENKVIGIVGNSLVMPVVPGLKLDTTYEFARATPNDLVHLYASGLAPPFRVSVPTRGVFAEAMLGKCSSCEVIDDARFWRWEEAPIPDRPSAISPLDLGSRRRPPPSVTPSAFPDAIVRLQEVPTAPDPTGLSAALELLGTKDLFKDITGLALNQAAAATALKSAMTAAQGFAQQGAALAQQRFLAGESDRALEQIKKARDRKDITPEQAQQLTESLIRGSLGEKRPASKPATENSAVQKAVGRVTSSAEGELRVTRPGGTVEVKTGPRAEIPAVDFTLDPPFAPVKQKTPNVCWAAGGTAIVSWRDRQSIPVETFLDGLGGQWRTHFDNDTALSAAEFRSFAAAAGLVEEGPVSFTVEGLLRELQNLGPLLTIGDDQVENDRMTHVLIAVGMRGDGTREGTNVFIADSAAGDIREESFNDFARRLEAIDPVRIGLGTYHF